MIGELDQRITLQNLTDTPDGIGGVTRAWSDVATVWARVKPQTGREAMAEGRMAATMLTKFTIRTRAVDETMRIVWGGVQYNIRQIPDSSPRDQFMDILAERGVAM